MNELSHHHLRVWHEAVGVGGVCRAHPIGDRELRDQATRAIKSCALNIAEGAGRVGKAKRYHYAVARGSVVEAVAAYELAAALGETLPASEVANLGSRIAAMLSGLLRR